MYFASKCVVQATAELVDQFTKLVENPVGHLLIGIAVGSQLWMDDRLKHDAPVS